MKKIIALFFLPVIAVACPETILYGDPCNQLIIDHRTAGLSIYQPDDICTEPLLNDGVCPDYLQGGCAAKGECKLKLEATKHPVLFGDE